MNVKKDVSKNVKSGASKDVKNNTRNSTSNDVKSSTTIPDPRAALDFPQHLRFPEDSELWSRLLTLAARKNRLLCKNLEGFRVEGTRIVVLESGGYGLRPVIRGGEGEGGGDNPDNNNDNYDPGSGWTSLADYRQYAGKYLRPHHDDLVRLLRALALPDPGELWGMEAAEAAETAEKTGEDNK